ncbi:shikimate kinase [Sphingomonas sp. F9_3S_D5_B_2]
MHFNSFSMAVAQGSGKATDRPIVLVGFMAAGKSKIGRALAQRLGLAFVDTDREVEERFGMSISDIFETTGESEFRAAERDVISRLLEDGPRVIAIGGGAFVDPENRTRLNAAAVTVWLDPPFDILLARLQRSAARPLASGRSESELHDLWHQRQASYIEAHLRIRTSDDPAQQFVEKIVRELERA